MYVLSPETENHTSWIMPQVGQVKEIFGKEFLKMYVNGQWPL